MASDAVAAALERALQLGEIGVQVAAYVDGELVVDAWAGDTGDGSGTAVDGDTLFPIFSVTKAVTATALHLQAQRGLVDYDAPVARYWPEYGVNGKDAVTVRHVLSHRAGVPRMPDGVTPELMLDWEWMTARLAAVQPAIAPGTRNTYLSMTFGWLIGEVVRRTDPAGRPFDRFVRDEICVPLGMDAFFLGVPEAERARVARLSFPVGFPGPLPAGSLVASATPEAVRLLPGVYNRADVQAGVVPAVGGVANARSVARFFAMIANGGELDGVRLLDESRVRSFLTPRDDYDAPDETYGRQMPVGNAAFWLRAPGVAPAGDDLEILAHTGAGGSIGWAELRARVGAAICHNRMFGAGGEPPFAALGAAVHDLAAGAPA
jgi:CubicO group peptidase (beta-lactamase class C family)